MEIPEEDSRERFPRKVLEKDSRERPPRKSTGKGRRRRSRRKDPKQGSEGSSGREFLKEVSGPSFRGRLRRPDISFRGKVPKGVIEGRLWSKPPREVPEGTSGSKSSFSEATAREEVAAQERGLSRMFTVSRGRAGFLEEEQVPSRKIPEKDARERFPRKIPEEDSPGRYPKHFGPLSSETS